MIEIAGMYEPSDYVRAQYLHIRPRPVYKVLGVLVLALFFWAAWLVITDDEIDGLDFLFLAMILALILNFTVYIPWKTRRVFNQQKALHRELVFKFDDSGISVTNENGQSTTPWDDYLRWKQNDQLALLYMSDCLYHMVPKRFFSDPADADRLIELVTMRIGKESA